MKKMFFICFIALLSVNSILLADGFASEIDNVTKKEKKTMQADKDINNAKLHDIASAIAVELKIPACVYFIKQRQEITIRN